MVDVKADLPKSRPWWFTIALCALGLGVSIALQWIHVRAYLVPTATSFCSLGERLDCSTVALSRFSVVAGVPLPILGAIGFLSMSIAAVRRSRWLLVLALASAGASVPLLALELFEIGSVCFLCEIVHAVCVALAVIAWRKRAELRPLTDRADSLYVLAPAIGLLLSALLFTTPYFRVFSWRSDVPFATGKTPEGQPWIGAERPKLVVHEYTDYACPHCKAAAVRSLRHLAAHSNEIRIVRHQNPRMRCPVDRPQLCQLVRVAYCAGEQGKFWQMDRWLFEHGVGKNQVDVTTAAHDVGVDADKLARCVARPDTFERVAKEAELVAKKRFFGTPYYVIDGKRVAPVEADRRMRDAK
jgi:uncharacterized membrane protein